MTEIPEWVYVWQWARSKGAVRPFPQQAAEVYPHEVDSVLTVEQYEELVGLWRKAGSPKQGGIVVAPKAKPIVRDLADILR